MIGAGKEHQTFGFSGGVCDLRQLLCRRKLIVVSAQEELGQGTTGQERIVVIVALPPQRRKPVAGNPGEEKDP